MYAEEGRVLPLGLEGHEFSTSFVAANEQQTPDQSLAEAVNTLTQTLARLRTANGNKRQSKEARCGQRCDTVIAPPYTRSTSSSASEGSSSTIRPVAADQPSKEVAEIRTTALATMFSREHTVQERHMR
jgi:hypothetical protein